MYERIVYDKKKSYVIFGESADLKDYPTIPVGASVFILDTKKVYSKIGPDIIHQVDFEDTASDEPSTEPEIDPNAPIALMITYDGSALPVGASLDTVPGLSVLALYSDDSIELVTKYEIDKSIVAQGNNEINIAYRGKTTSFNMNGIDNTIDPNAVDLVLFTGQSNMSGRGLAEDAPIVPEGYGYWYKDPSFTNMAQAPAGLYQITEPFGLEKLCTGSLVSEFALTHYKQTGYPIVAIAGAIGGRGIESFVPGGDVYGKYNVEAVTKAKAYLEANGKTIRRAFVVFNQGESDAGKTSKASYIEQFNSFWADLKSRFGFEKMFIIELGQYNGDDMDITEIKAAHTELADTNADIHIVSSKFTGATAYMDDNWHYTQPAYNAVGRDAAINAAVYYNNAVPALNEFTGLDASLAPIASIGSLQDWNYEIIGGSVKLKQYIGTNPDVYVHAYYTNEGKIYKGFVAAVETKITSGTLVPVDGTVAPFAKNTVITSVTFEDGSDLENNNAGCLFYGCTALKTVTNIPNAAGGSASLCYGCTSLTTFPTFAKYGASLNQAFRGCSNLEGTADTIILPPHSDRFGNLFRDCKKITSVGNVPDNALEVTAMYQNCTSLVSAGDVCLSAGSLCTSVFYGCTSLQSVGKIYGDSVTSIANLFQNCKKLEGVVRIECPNITKATGAFGNVDLTKITIQVPADSTTYTTLTTEYPTANIVTF